MKADLVAGCAVLHHFGLDQGGTGHLSGRDPVEPSKFWVNPLGAPLRLVAVRDLVLVDMDALGSVPGGTVNESALAVLPALYSARDDVVGVVHGHAPFITVLAARGELIAPLTQDACAFFEDQALYETYLGVIKSAAEGQSIASALGPRKSLIMKNHGGMTVGGSMGSAVWWLLALERAAEVQVHCGTDPAASPPHISTELARRVHDEVGSERAAQFQFDVTRRSVLGRPRSLYDRRLRSDGINAKY